jgi:hypothetical protein
MNVVEDAVDIWGERESLNAFVDCGFSRTSVVFFCVFFFNLFVYVMFVLSRLMVLPCVFSLTQFAYFYLPLKE